MAGTTKEMSTIKQVLRYHLDGVSNNIGLRNLDKCDAARI